MAPLSRSPAPARGFTLLEMAVVLAVIGLLIGAVVGGQAIRRASQIRDMIGQYDAAVQAVKEFQDKYHALPGDMIGAQAIWGVNPTGCPAGNTSQSQIPTCDGNGNGFIGDGTMRYNPEWFTAWQQLADAGFFSGSYTGAQGPGNTNQMLPGVNVPQSTVPNSSAIINYMSTTIPTGAGGANLWANPLNIWPDQYGHVMSVGAWDSNTVYPDGAILNSAEAFDVDSKIDDGMPGTGKVRTWRGLSNIPSNKYCTSDTGVQATTTYLTTTAGAAVGAKYTCSLIFLMGF